MKVILLKDVEALGDCGDVLDVSNGYYRNYLDPHKLAVIATDGALKDLQRRIERLRAQAEKKYQEDKAKADKIEAIGLLTITANVGESGKLFGTITTKELAQLISEKSGLEVERKNVNVDHPMNRVGDYNAFIKLSSKVSATLSIKVIGEEAEQA